MAQINLISAEGDLFEYEIIHGTLTFYVQGYQYNLEDVLLFTGVDVDGPGQHQLGRKIFAALTDVCQEFCKQQKTTRIIILGAKRSTGKTFGTFFRPIYRKFD